MNITCGQPSPTTCCNGPPRGCARGAARALQCAALEENGDGCEMRGPCPGGRGRSDPERHVTRGHAKVQMRQRSLARHLPPAAAAALRRSLALHRPERHCARSLGTESWAGEADVEERDELEENGDGCEMRGPCHGGRGRSDPESHVTHGHALDFHDEVFCSAKKRAMAEP
jgi:hypothetical protein